MCAVLVCCGAFGAGALLFVMHAHWIDLSVLEHYNPGKPSILLDDEGKQWGRFELDRRDPVSLDRMPRYVINAFVAAEDREFFNHHGISWRGIVRSVLVNIRAGKIVQGASTITQQLVKLLFFDSHRTFKRKIKEQCCALLVERQCTKEQIIQTYLNHVYFGCGIYGVEAAAQRFWGVSVEHITIDQAAMLAAIVKSPGTYCPLLGPHAARQRRNVILGIMAEMGFITAEQMQQAQEAPLGLVVHTKTAIAPHLKESIRIMLERMYGKRMVYSGGLQVQTTLNRKAQIIAQQEFVKQITKLRTELKLPIDGALMSIETQTGEIKALVGGFDFERSQFNRALQARRQMGSIFKPIVYAAAVQQGITFDHVEVDEPIELTMPGSAPWRPRNNTRTFAGPMTLAHALSYSNNTITIKTLMNVGCQNVAHLAEKFHFTDTIPVYPSLALGCIDITLKEAVAAFNVFTNHGVYCEPYYIKWIKNEWGEKIYKAAPVTERILPAAVSDQVASVLGIGMQRYKQRFRATAFPRHAIGKTGTTNDSRTNWFSGATPGLTTSLYIGCDDNQSLGADIFPVWTAFPIWLGLYEQLGPWETVFAHDSSLRPVMINWHTGERTARVDDPEAVTILMPRAA